MEIRQSAEDYLEAILMIKERKGYVRSIDVASQLGVTKPSVTYATKRLKENGYITMDEANMISLTDSGMAIANKIYTRHKVLTALFTHLGVDPELAREDACKVEHDLSEETFAALCKHASALTEIPLAEEEEAEREAEAARANKAAKNKQ
ncbi:MAG: metal-dependent transcriptional regulator [Chordicoccus sp.]